MDERDSIPRGYPVSPSVGMYIWLVLLFAAVVVWRLVKATSSPVLVISHASVLFVEVVRLSNSFLLASFGLGGNRSHPYSLQLKSPGRAKGASSVVFTSKRSILRKNVLLLVPKLGA